MRGSLVLAAIWAVFGGSLFGGVSLKIQYFLQVFLILSAFLDVFAHQFRNMSTMLSSLIRVIGTAFICFYLTYLVAGIYPEQDLNGYGRLVSNTILLAPLVILVKALDLRSSTLFKFFIFQLVAHIFMSLAFHPVSFLLYILVIVPILAVIMAWCLYKRSLRITRYETCLTIIFAAILGASICLQDPWISSKIHDDFFRLDKFAKIAGVEFYSDAVRSGNIRPIEKADPIAIAECDLACIEKKVREFSKNIYTDIAKMHLQKDVLMYDSNGSRMNTVIATCVYSSIVIIFLFSLFKIRSLSYFNFSIFGIMFIFSFLVAFGHFALSQLTGFIFMVKPNHDWWLVSGYMKSYGRILAHPLWGFYLIGALAIILYLLLDKISPNILTLCTALHRSPKTWLALLILSTLALNGLLVNTQTYIGSNGFQTKINLKDIQSGRELFQNLSKDDHVLTGAIYAKLNGENWLLPAGGATSLLPFIDRKVHFSVRLGSGYIHSWRDLVDEFYSDESKRESFLNKHRIQWLLDRRLPHGQWSLLHEKDIKVEALPLSLHYDQPTFEVGGYGLFKF